MRDQAYSKQFCDEEDTEKKILRKRKKLNAKVFDIGIQMVFFLNNEFC